MAFRIEKQDDQRPPMIMFSLWDPWLDTKEPIIDFIFLTCPAPRAPNAPCMSHGTVVLGKVLLKYLFSKLMPPGSTIPVESVQ